MSCLSSGMSDAIHGCVSITPGSASGWVSARCDVVISVDEKATMKLSKDSLCDVSNGRWAFSYQFTADIKVTGLRLIRVFACVEHVSSGELVD